MTRHERDYFDVHGFIARHGGAISKYADRQIVYAQGDPSDALFYIVSGTVKVAVNSEYGKEAVIAILEARDFFGVRCLVGDLLRSSTIVTTSVSEIARFDRAIIVRALSDDASFANVFLKFILDRNQKLQADLVDQIFNSSEKRLARTLLMLANSGLGTQSSFITFAIDQEMLANMVGTTRSRINQFMNKFRRLGYIEYNGKIKVNNSLLNLILRDQPDSDNKQQSEMP
jgi:CRP-like cAMP-binding protein